ncbi:MAG: hypothetical protein ABIU97_08980 [Dehalococcoidia bacterium]
MTIRAAPTLTTCDLCDAKMAAMRGPYSMTIGRPTPPDGYRMGYMVELDGREFPICRPYLDKTLAPVA